jgi:hypothetical protein
MESSPFTVVPSLLGLVLASHEHGLRVPVVLLAP